MQSRYLIIIAVVTLLINGLAYPFLTNGLETSAASAMLNTTTLVLVASLFSVIVLTGGSSSGAAMARTCTNRAVLALLPTLAWASFVNLAQTLACVRA